MDTSKTFARLLVAAAGLAAGWACAADRPDPGRREYLNSCAACHGIDGKGTGPLWASLKKLPSDLTLLTRRNGGVFPAERMQQVIDGREELQAHGSRDMPVWGQRYANLGWNENFDLPYNADAYVLARILVLTDYLHRMQVK